jgi:tRNA(fMet)-specific endonuclease VapC
LTYLLDTNLCISYLRGLKPAVLERFQSHDPDELSVCATVRSELIYGALRSREPTTQLEVVRNFLKPLRCLVFDATVADAAARIRSNLVATGNVIGPYDLQIAATALELGLTLVTHNVAEFTRIAGLRVDDWEA